MLSTITAAVVLAAASICSQCAPERKAVPPAPPVCAPGEIIVHNGEIAPCDLIGGANTLTVIGTTEAECDDMGGDERDAVCFRVDF